MSALCCPLRFLRINNSGRTRKQKTPGQAPLPLSSQKARSLPRLFLMDVSEDL